MKKEAVDMKTLILRNAIENIRGYLNDIESATTEQSKAEVMPVTLYDELTSAMKPSAGSMIYTYDILAFRGKYESQLRSMIIKHEVEK